jgi:hypothetical protein
LFVLVACRTLLEPGGDSPPSTAQTDWSQLLKEVVTDDGLVDYDTLERHRDVLDNYVKYVGTPEAVPSASIRRVPFWINAYNALVLYSVLEHGRPPSVAEIDGWLPWAGSAFYAETEFRVGKERLSLFEIRHERIRGRSQDVRVHSAVACPARSCPPLRRELYHFPGYSGQLDDQMRAWLSDPDRGVRIEGDHVALSALFERFAYDFDHWTGGDDPCTIASRYLTGEPSRRLVALAYQGCPRETMAWDSSLNEAP